MNIFTYLGTKFEQNILQNAQFIKNYGKSMPPNEASVYVCKHFQFFQNNLNPPPPKKKNPRYTTDNKAA